jgi:hypothetical protein
MWVIYLCNMGCDIDSHRGDDHPITSFFLSPTSCPIAFVVMLGIPKIWESCNVHIVGAPLELANNSFSVELKQSIIVIHQKVNNLDMHRIDYALKEFLKCGLWSYLPFLSSHVSPL